MFKLLGSFVLAVGVWSAAADHAAAGEAPARVAIAGGVETEIAFLLGAEAQIVGVDQTSRHPPAAMAKAQLGYFRRISAEGVLSLGAEALIASPDAGPPGALDQLRGAGVAVQVTPRVDRLAELPAKARFVAAALGRDAAGETLAARLEAEVSALEASVGAAGAAHPRVLFVLTVRDGAPLAAGAGTAPAEVIRLAGARNVADFDGFKPMSREAVLAAAPDLVLMTDEHSAALGGPTAVLSQGELAATPAGAAGRALAAPALTVLSLGPRTPETVRRLRAAF